MYNEIMTSKPWIHIYSVETFRWIEFAKDDRRLHFATCRGGSSGNSSDSGSSKKGEKGISEKKERKSAGQKYTFNQSYIQAPERV